MNHWRSLVVLAIGFAAATQFLDARAADDEKWGTITGQVKMSKAPKPAVIEVNTDKEHCLSKGPLFQQDVLVGKNGGVEHVVVWLRPDSDDRRAPFPADKIHPDLVKAVNKTHIVDQPCCQFIPRVVAARAGDKIEFKNSAPVNHNINYASDAEPFNVNLTPNTSKTTKPLEAQTGPIPFKCDIHPWMAGRVRVFDHPYYAITDAEGNFTIKNAPPGKWRLVYWHENGYHKGREGAMGFPLEVKGGETTKLDAIDLELP
jgi:plastocyanin